MRQPQTIRLQQDEWAIHDQLATNSTAQRFYTSVYHGDMPSDDRVIVTCIRLGDADNTLKVHIKERLQTLKMLNEVSVAPILDYDVQDNIVYVVREQPDNTLADLLQRGNHAYGEAIALFNRLCEAVKTIHEQGVLHLNLTPDNILFHDDGVLLADFALYDIPTRIIYGTPSYLAPEQLRGEAMGMFTDVYALGLILYEMLTGTSAIDNTPYSTPHAIIQAQLTMPPVPPSTHNPALSPALDVVLMRVLEKAPKKRYQTVATLQEALQNALSGASSGKKPKRDFAITQLSPIIYPLLVATIIIGIFVLTSFVIYTTAPANDQIHALTDLIQQNNSTALNELVVDDNMIARAHTIMGDEGFIAYIACTRSTEYHALLAREISQRVDDYGLQLRIYDQAVDAYDQVNLIEQARTEGVHGFVICPLDLAYISETIMTLVQDNIPVVLTDGTIVGTVTVTEDNTLLGHGIGRYAGIYVRDYLEGQAQVLVIENPALPNLVARADAMVTAMKTVAPQAEVVATITSGTRETSYTNMREFLTDETDFDVILSINDASAFGAIQAMEDAGIDAQSIAVFSIDGERWALQYIAEQYYVQASTAINVLDKARGLVDALIMLLAGEQISSIIEILPGDISLSPILINTIE